MQLMKTLRSPISIKDLGRAEYVQGNLVKAVIDVDKQLISIGGELHADGEKELLDSGSKQPALWGINLYPDKFGTRQFIEFDSMINLRPSQHNRSRGVDDPAIRKRIAEIVGKLVAR